MEDFHKFFKPHHKISGYSLIKVLGVEHANDPCWNDFLAKDKPSHLFVIRIYHPGSREKYKIDSLRESRRATSYHPSLVQFCDSGTTASPWGEVDYAVFEPLIPLTWLVDYEAGRRRVFPPGFIWVLAKNTIEGLACLHSCGITMLGSSLSNCALTLSYINGLESREKKEIFHSVWANTDIDNSGRLRRGSLGDIGYSIKLGPLEGTWPTNKLHTLEFRDHNKLLSSFVSPAPEVQSKNLRSPAMNVWDIGNMLAQRVCGGSRQQLFDIPAGDFHIASSDTLYQQLKAASDAGPKTFGLAFPDHDLRIFADLLKQMLARDPKDRISAQAASRHTFFSTYRPTTSSTKLGSAQPAPSPRREDRRPRSPPRRPQDPRVGRRAR